MHSDRRQFLKGVSFGAGSLVLAPLVHQLQAHAAGTADRPQRFVFVLEGNGLPWQQIMPAGITRPKDSDRNSIVTLPIGDRALPKALEPLSPWKDRVTVINGLSGKVAGGGHSNNYGALGCYDANGSVGHCGTPAGETIDCALAKKLGGIFPQVGLGMIDKGDQAVVYNCSAWEKGKPMPTTCRPDVAYGALFGSIAGGAAKQEFLARNNMLDFLTDDLKRLEAQLAGPEREKLGQHLAAYETLRARQSRLNEIENTLRKNGPVVSNKYTSNVETDRLDAMFDLAAAALVGGLTNVVTLASGVGDPYFGVKFTGLGINFGKHGIGHGGSYNGMTWDVMSTTIRRFHFELIARLIKKLEGVQEGNGTMLDNTVFVYLSDAAEGHHSRCWEWPFVVVGNLGGRLKAGSYIEYPYWGKKGHKTIGNLYTTFLHAAGDKRPHFGLKDPMLKDLDLNGPLPELLA